MTSSKIDFGRAAVKKAAAVNIMGAVSPAARPTPKIAPVRTPGNAGEDDPGDGAPFVTPRAREASRNVWGTALRASSAAPDDRREDQDSERQRTGEDAGAETEKYDEKTEAEKAENNGGYAGKTVHPDTDDPDKGTLLCVFR